MSEPFPVPSDAEQTTEAVDTVPGRVIASAQMQSYTGPMPPPDYLRQYNEIVPGAAQTILAEFLANAAHQRDMEQTALNADISLKRRNQFFAGGLVLIGFCLIMALAWTGHDWVAGIVAGTLLGAVITGFLTGRKETDQD